MPASRHLFRPDPDGRPRPGSDATDLVAYLQGLGRERRDVWAELRRLEPDIPEPPSAGPGLLRRGAELYREECAACHGEAGDGRGEAADLLVLPPRDFRSGLYRFKSTPDGSPPTDADLFRSITLGTGAGSAMPAFDWLPATDRWALVLRLKEFSAGLRGAGLSGARRSTGAAPEPIPASGGTEKARLIERGRRLWDDLGCGGCHGGAGGGTNREEAGASWADPAGTAVPRVSRLDHACFLRGGASAEAVDRAILLGEGLAMPEYRETLQDGEMARALREFVLSLQDAPEGP